MAAVVVSVLSTWRTGRRLVHERLLRGGIPLTVSRVEASPRNAAGAHEGAGAAWCRPRESPQRRCSPAEYNGAVHETVLVISVVTLEVPHIDAERRTEQSTSAPVSIEVSCAASWRTTYFWALAAEAAPKLGSTSTGSVLPLGRESLRARQAGQPLA